MRTNETFTQANFQPEFARRIKALRLALGYRRKSDLAEVLGFSQQQMSNWERGKPTIKEWEAVRDRIALLARYLGNPIEFADDLRKKAEHSSPILGASSSIQDLTYGVCDWNICADEWDASLAAALWGSRSPFERSAIVAAEERDLENIPAGECFVPKVAEVIHDLKIHGEKFVQGYKASWEELLAPKNRDFHVDKLHALIGFGCLLDSLEEGVPVFDGSRQASLKERLNETETHAAEVFAWKRLKQIVGLIADSDGFPVPEKAQVAWDVVVSFMNGQIDIFEEEDEKHKVSFQKLRGVLQEAEGINAPKT